MEHGATQEQIHAVENFIREQGFDAHISQGELHTIIGAVGGKIIDEREIQLLDGVREIIRISTSYKLASRAFQKEDTIIKINDVTIGGNQIAMIAGPCTIESYEQMDETAKALSDVGIKILRGGAFKPRTSPYSFQGLGEEGLKIIRRVADKYNMLVTSEVMQISQIPMFMKYVDYIAGRCKKYAKLQPPQRTRIHQQTGTYKKRSCKYNRRMAYGSGIRPFRRKP